MVSGSGSNDDNTSRIFISSRDCGVYWGFDCVNWSWYGFAHGFLRYFCRPPRTLSNRTPSFSIPIRRHFRNRQAWHAFRRRLFISQSLLAGQVYSILPKWEYEIDEKLIPSIKNAVNTNPGWSSWKMLYMLRSWLHRNGIHWPHPHTPGTIDAVFPPLSHPDSYCHCRNHLSLR